MTNKSEIKRLITLGRPEVALQEIERLEAEVRRLQTENKKLTYTLDQGVKDVAEIRRLREVVEFYSDPNGAGEDSNFCLVGEGFGDDEVDDSAAPIFIKEIGDDGITRDIGTKARAALEGK